MEIRYYQINEMPFDSKIPIRKIKQKKKQLTSSTSMKSKESEYKRE